jgi:hypothetical protein
MLSAWYGAQTYIEQIAQVFLPPVEIMARLTEDNFEFRLAKSR